MSTKDVIENVIGITFTTIKKVYDYQKEKESECKFCDDVGSRIVFPTYSDGSTTRISEQELRFIFVEQFNKYVVENQEKIDDDLYYSVETPTKKKYIFSKHKGGPKKEKEEKEEKVEKDDKGVSARTDLVIFQKEEGKFRRKALIEFKALNPKEENYLKDICKLENEESCELKYFIQIIENYDYGTLKSLNNKIKKMKADINYKCYCLGEGEDVTEKVQKCK